MLLKMLHLARMLQGWLSTCRLHSTRPRYQAEKYLHKLPSASATSSAEIIYTKLSYLPRSSRRTTSLPQLTFSVEALLSSIFIAAV